MDGWTGRVSGVLLFPLSVTGQSRDPLASPDWKVRITVTAGTLPGTGGLKVDLGDFVMVRTPVPIATCSHYSTVSPGRLNAAATLRRALRGSAAMYHLPYCILHRS